MQIDQVEVQRASQCSISPAGLRRVQPASQQRSRESQCLHISAFTAHRFAQQQPHTHRQTHNLSSPNTPIYSPMMMPMAMSGCEVTKPMARISAQRPLRLHSRFQPLRSRSLGRFCARAEAPSGPEPNKELGLVRLTHSERVRQRCDVYGPCHNLVSWRGQQPLTFCWPQLLIGCRGSSASVVDHFHLYDVEC